MEHLEDRLRPLLPVRSQPADLFERLVGVLSQRRVPNGPRHVLQARRQAAERFVGQAVSHDARPPLSPDLLGDRRRVELAGRNRAVSAGLAVLARRFGVLARRERRAGDDPAQELHQRPELLLADPGRRRQLVERRVQQFVERPPQKHQRQSAIAGEGPKGERLLQVRVYRLSDSVRRRASKWVTDWISSIDGVLTGFIGVPPRLRPQAARRHLCCPTQSNS